MKMSALFLLLLGCSQPAAAPPASQAGAASSSPQSETGEVRGPHVIFPDGFVVRVEIAADDELRAQGLMYRDHLRPGTGMLFLFPGDDERSFWMKNTKIPLDIIWIGADRRIVGLLEDVPPCEVPDCPSYSPGAVNSRYVLEVAGGVAREHQLKTGDLLQIEQIANIPVR